ncbi:MAG: DUF1707 domain-containing protein [Solirubrobacterales bacterium]|nr:DUF1707 domain-containing protein [Solirubrobacterales bacterium]
MRASDADRERVVSELEEHAAEGRIDTDELEDRIERAYAARTTQELDELSRDLPQSRALAALTQRARRRHLGRRVIQETGGSLGAFVVCAGIWLAAGVTGAFWPIWILALFVLSLVRNGWLLFGPAADLDAVEAQLDARRDRHGSHRARHDAHQARRDARRAEIDRRHSERRGD